MRASLSCLFLAASALAQTSAPPAFDVASVKINQTFDANNRATWLTGVERNAGNLTLRNFNMTMLVAWAYDIERPQIVGPDAMDSQRYDIFAKAGNPVSDETMQQMMQTLLAERFKLVVHREKRPMDILALTVPKGGHKMQPSKVEGRAQSHQDPERGTVVEGAVISELAKELSRETQVPIVDMTGLTGRFDLSFNPPKYLAALRARLASDPHPPTDAEARVMIIQDLLAGDLGLRLEPRRAPVEVIVVDHAEKSPVEN